ncbi:MAG: DUF5716 family protein [Lachnospiraceae bacterium]
MAALMLGLDFSKTDLLISLWNEDRTCAEIYNFSGVKGDEFIPSMVIYADDGRLLVGKEAVEYSLRTQKSGITALYGQNAGDTVELNGVKQTVEELLSAYLDTIFSMIRKRFGGALIARIGITGERLSEAEKTRLTGVFEKIGYPKEKLYFSTHADAFLWYELCEGQTESGSLKYQYAMALDYDSRGMFSYLLHPADEEKETPYYLETVDYSELMPGGLVSIRQEEEQNDCFSRMTELALNRREVSRLYVTGLYAETSQAAEVLQKLSRADRRIFCGRSLYALGVCYHAVKERFSRKVISDRQIFHNVSLLAYQNARSGPVPLLTAGTALSAAAGRVQVLLDDTLELKFQIEDMRTRKSITCTFQPEDLRVRENKTIRMEISIRFLDYNTLVIKLRDIGFGSIYPATFRVWEQIVYLGRE